MNNSFQHPAAVLSICFGTSPMTGFSGGLDKRVRQWDFGSGQCRVLGKHEGPVSAMVWCTEFSEYCSACRGTRSHPTPAGIQAGS